MIALIALMVIVYFVYMFGRVIVGIIIMYGGEPSRLRAFVNELKLPFAVVLIAWIPVMIMSGYWSAISDYMMVGFGVLALIVPDDDDRWKRRRRKLRDKVAEIGGRLTVVPAT